MLESNKGYYTIWEYETIQLFSSRALKVQDETIWNDFLLLHKIYINDSQLAKMKK